jgi:hypothetical protein
MKNSATIKLDINPAKLKRNYYGI